MSASTTSRVEWLKMIFAVAKESGHIFPDYAACEAALESGYGTSSLAAKDNNLFGTKQHLHPVYGTVSLPTQEWSPKLNKFVPAVANWIVYPDLAACFKDRIQTLQRLSTATNDAGDLEFPGYAAALSAQDGETFVIQVSRHWSTDPQRAQKVILIHQLYAEVFA